MHHTFSTGVLLSLRLHRPPSSAKIAAFDAGFLNATRGNKYRARDFPLMLVATRTYEQASRAIPHVQPEANRMTYTALGRTSERKAIIGMEIWINNLVSKCRLFVFDMQSGASIAHHPPERVGVPSRKCRGWFRRGLQIWRYLHADGRRARQTQDRLASQEDRRQIMKRVSLIRSAEADTGCQKRLIILAFIIVHLIVIYKQVHGDHLVGGKGMDILTSSPCCCAMHSNFMLELSRGNIVLVVGGCDGGLS